MGLSWNVGSLLHSGEMKKTQTPVTYVEVVLYRPDHEGTLSSFRLHPLSSGKHLFAVFWGVDYSPTGTVQLSVLS